MASQLKQSDAYIASDSVASGVTHAVAAAVSFGVTAVVAPRPVAQMEADDEAMS